jgi:hypothetical protein
MAIVLYLLVVTAVDCRVELALGASRSYWLILEEQLETTYGEFGRHSSRDIQEKR